jgi:hypothetical protein
VAAWPPRRAHNVARSSSEADGVDAAVDTIEVRSLRRASKPAHVDGEFMRLTLSLLVLWVALAGCDAGYQPELGDTRADDAGEATLAARTQAAPLPFGSAVQAELSARTPSFLFTFELTAAATISLRTQAVDGGPEVDTVLALSRVNQNGLPRLIAASDDFEQTKFSGLDRKLSGGSYQLVVRGHSLLRRGAFVLTSRCTGSGCPLPMQSCLFGEQFSDLRGNAALEVVSEEWLSSEAQLVDVLERDQLVLAVQQSSHTDVTTPNEALAVVDQQQVRRLVLEERSADGRSFSAYEYGVGDNSYGAIFETGTLTLVASIHDGDLLDCAVTN